MKSVNKKVQKIIVTVPMSSEPIKYHGGSDNVIHEQQWQFTHALTHIHEIK
jgi:hypothetical protein